MALSADNDQRGALDTNYSTGERIFISVSKLNSLGRMYLTDPEIDAIRAGKLRHYLKVFMNETPLFPRDPKNPIRDSKDMKKDFDQTGSSRRPITARSQTNFKNHRSLLSPPHMSQHISPYEVERGEGSRALSFSGRLKGEHNLNRKRASLKNQNVVLKQVFIDLSNKSPRVRYTPRHPGIVFPVAEKIEQDFSFEDQSFVMANNSVYGEVTCLAACFNQ